MLCICLQPTYGTPVSEGLAQLRIYNGFDCNFNITLTNPYALQNQNRTDSQVIGPLSVYENLKILASNSTDVPYFIQGQENSPCAHLEYAGTFTLLENTANSYFINNNEIYSFIDNNDKAIDGVNVR